MKKLKSNIKSIEKTWDKVFGYKTNTAQDDKYREVIILNFNKEIPVKKLKIRKLNKGIAIFI